MFSLNRQVIADFLSDAQPIYRLLPSPSANTSPKQGQGFLSAKTEKIAK
jgi:hypothetical protein